MALQLETLSFQVDSSQLDDARIKIAKLGDAVNALNRPMQEMQRSSAKTAEAIAKSELAAEKARVAKEKLADSASTVTAKVDPLTKLMEKLSNTYTDMAAGMTRGESSILNQARSYGAMGDQLKAVADILQNIKTLNKDPLDASLGGVRSITQEFERLQQRADLAAQGILMTTKQLGEYSKLAAEARGRVVGLGMDPDSLEGQKVYNQLLSQSQKEYLDVLSVVKQLTDAEQQRLAVAKEQERLQKAAASASAARMQEWAKGVGGKSPELSSMAAFYKEQEVAARKLTAAEDDLILREQKLAFVNKELAAGLTTASANTLFKYQKDLEALGKSTDEITKRTTAFRAGLVEKQGHSPIKKIADDAAEARKQVDHLARALGPQITDIFVGLATGQSPLMVLLQQGGQLRDQFALAGVEAGNMGESLRTAASYMITSVKDVAVAIGQLLVSAVVGAGKKITELTLAMVGMGDAFAALSTRAPALTTGIAAIVGILGGAFLASTIALGVAFFKVQKSLDDLTKSLTLTGGSLGLTTDSAISLAISMEDVGISSSKAMSAIQAMAKEGGFARSEIQMITQSSVEMQKYLGIAVEDTVKQFAKLKGEPVDALLEVAKTTGMISPEIIAAVMALKDQGKEAEAAAIAMKAYADATVEQVQRAKTEYTDFGRFMIELVGTIASFWDTIKGVVIKASPTQELENLRAEMQRNLDFSFTDTQKKYWSAQLESVNRQILRQQELNSAVEQERVANVKNARVLEEARKIEIASMDTLEKLRRNKQIAEDRIAKTKKDSDLSQVARNAIISASEKELAKIKEDIAKEQKRNNAETTAAAKKLEEQRKKDLNVYQDLMNKADGANKSYNDNLESLDRLLKQGTISQNQYNEALGYLIRSQPGFIKQMQDLVKAFEDYDKAIQGANASIKDWNAQAIAESQQLEFKRNLIGKTSEEQALLNIEAAKQAKLTKLQLDLEKELDKYRGTLTPEDFAIKQQQLTDENAKLRKNAEDEASIAIAQKQYEEFKKVQDDISGIIADALFEGGKKGADSLKNYLKTTFRNYVIKVFIEPIVGNLLSSLGVKGGTGKIGDFASIVNQGGGLFGGYSSGLGNSIISAGNTAGRFLYDIGFEKAGEALVNTFNSVSEAGQTISKVGNYAGDALAYLNAFNTALKNPYAGAGQAIGYYFGGPLGSYIGGEIGKAVGDLMGWSGGDPDAFLVQQAAGTRQSYATSTTSAFGTIGFVNGRGTIMKNGRLVSEKGETEGVPVTAQKTALELIRNLDNAIASTLSESQISTISKNLSGWYKKSWSFEGKMLEDWIASRYETILKGLDGSFGKVKDYQKEGEKLSETTIRLITNLTTVYGAFETLGISTRNVSAKFSTNLVEMLGGVSNFSSAMQYFYENFYSEEERFKNQSKRLTDSFAALGLAVPKTRDEFKKLLEGALSSGNTGLSGKLIALMQPLNDFISATEEVAVSVSSITEEYARLTEKIMTNEEIAQQRIDLEQRLFEATASQAEIAAKARSEIAGYNLALYDQVIAAEASKKAEEARLEEIKKAEEARLEAEKVILDQRKSLQDEYFALTASQEQIAAKARSEIDASNLAIYDMVVAVKAAKAAEELRLEEFKKAEEARLEIEKQINDERANLQQRLFEATATEAQILAKARSEISAYNIALYDQVIAAENAKKAEEARAEAERVILDQRKSLQDRLFEATATEAQIVEKARSEIDASNLALYDQVIAAEKAKSASQKLADSMNQLTDSLLSEVDRLRGEIRNTSSVSGNVTGLSAEYLSTVLSAKSGNMQAIEKLPEYTKAIEQAVTATAVNSYDVVYARAWLASSLSGVADTINGSTASTQTVGTPIISTGATVQTNGASLISSNASSQAELIAALITEVQGLRAEVRADVSANTKTSRILERVNQDGDTLNVTAV